MLEVGHTESKAKSVKLRRELRESGVVDVLRGACPTAVLRTATVLRGTAAAPRRSGHDREEIVVLWN